MIVVEVGDVGTKLSEDISAVTSTPVFVSVFDVRLIIGDGDVDTEYSGIPLWVGPVVGGGSFMLLALTFLTLTMVYCSKKKRVNPRKGESQWAASLRRAARS